MLSTLVSKNNGTMQLMLSLFSKDSGGDFVTKYMFFASFDFKQRGK